MTVISCWPPYVFSCFWGFKGSSLSIGSILLISGGQAPLFMLPTHPLCRLSPDSLTKYWISVTRYWHFFWRSYAVRWSAASSKFWFKDIHPAKYPPFWENFISKQRGRLLRACLSYGSLVIEFISSFICFSIYYQSVITIFIIFCFSKPSVLLCRFTFGRGYAMI